jgi:hypothetical protein
MAVAAGDIERPVRAADRPALHVLLRHAAKERHGQQRKQKSPLNV